MALFNSRISSYQMNYFMRGYVNRTTIDLQKASTELATGRHENLYAELGARSATAITMRVHEEETQSYIKSNNVLGNKLQSTLNAVDGIRASLDSVLQNALMNVTRPNTGAETIQTEARAAIEAIVGALNQSFNGDHIFAGTQSRDAPMTRWDEVNPATGYSPESALSAVVGAGPTTATEAATMIADFQSIFDSSYTADPNMNYESTFYIGTPELDGSGVENNRVTARLASDQQLNYGVQANDPAIREALRGLSMLASFDPITMTDEATYQAWMGEATETLAIASERLLETSAQIGFHQEIVEKAVVRLEDLSIVQRTQIGTLENIDTYEVATRLTSLETQLEASYSVTSRLGDLSLLRYL